MTAVRVLVTGATGFLGGHLLVALTAAGHQPRAFVRSPEKLALLLDRHGLGPVEYCVGDVTDAASVAAAVDGCDAAIHAAAVVSLDPVEAIRMSRSNLAGVTNMLSAAAAKGCDPVVYVSSTSALAPCPNPTMRAEDPVPAATTDYAESKGACERLARDHQSDGRPVVIFYPGGIVGPVDAGTNVFGDNMLQALEPGFIPVAMSGGQNYIDVRDLADAIIRSLTPGLGPRRFMAGGTYLDWYELAAVLDDATGRAWRHVSIPAPVLRGVGRVGDLVARFRPGWRPPLGLEAAVTMTTGVPTDDSALRNDLGVAYRDVGESMADLFRWQVQEGRLDPARAPRWADHAPPG